jgi:hypothetical protein
VKVCHPVYHSYFRLCCAIKAQAVEPGAAGEDCANGSKWETREAIVKAVVALLDRESVIGLARTPPRAADLGIEIRAGDYNDKPSSKNH